VTGPIYTPPIVKDTGGKLGTIQLPGAGGGANWMGGAVDPETGMLYIPSTTSPYISSLVPGGDRSEMPYIAGGGGGNTNVAGNLPLIKGPYGRITAFNLNTGDQAWMIPNGKPSDAMVNNPALKAAGIDASNWGGGQRSPILITKTMLVEGSADLRFIDKKSGAVIYEMPLGSSVGPTMTYLDNGRQFIVAVVNGTPGNGAELVGLAVGQPAGPGGRGGRGGRGGAGGRGAAAAPEN
jgi:quinoprotein glucose dehydrogenase